MKKIFVLFIYFCSAFAGFGLSLAFTLRFFESRNNKLFPTPIYDQRKEIPKSEIALSIYNPIKKTTFNLSEQTEKILFVNFWATWCAPCIAEMPSIDSLKQNLTGYKIDFLLVSDENSEIVEKFAKKKQKLLSLDFYCAKSNIPSIIDGSTLPRTYIIYKGEILYQHTGMIDWNNEDIKNIIKDALKKP